MKNTNIRSKVKKQEEIFIVRKEKNDVLGRGGGAEISIILIYTPLGEEC